MVQLKYVLAGVLFLVPMASFAKGNKPPVPPKKGWIQQILEGMSCGGPACVRTDENGDMLFSNEKVKKEEPSPADLRVFRNSDEGRTTVTLNINGNSEPAKLTAEQEVLMSQAPTVAYDLKDYLPEKGVAGYEKAKGICENIIRLSENWSAEIKERARKFMRIAYMRKEEGGGLRAAVREVFGFTKKEDIDDKLDEIANGCAVVPI